MSWFLGPLPEIWGIPTFWITRIAKIVQLFSGMVIVFDIAGEHRVKEWADSVRQGLADLAAAQPLRDMAGDLCNVAKSFLNYFFTLPWSEQADEKLMELVGSKYNRQARLIWLNITIAMAIAAVVYLVLSYGWNRNLLWQFVLVLLASALISLLFTYLVLFNLLSVLIIAVVRPIEWVFDIFASGVVSLLRHRTLRQTASFLSFVLLALGTFSELAAS